MCSHPHGGWQRWVLMLQVMSLTLMSLLVSITLTPPLRAYACTPPLPPWPPTLTARDYVQHADYIFVGQVITTSAPVGQFSPFYSATIQISVTLKGVISNTEVIVGDFGTSALCKTDIAPGPDSLIFFAHGSSEAQLNIIYRLSGPIDHAGVFPATEDNLNEVRYPFRVWLPPVYRL